MTIFKFITQLSEDSQKYVEIANLAFKNALVGEKLANPTFMIVLNTMDGLLQSVEGIENALFYKRES